MEINLKFDGFQRNKGTCQHYYLNGTWEENPELEFEGSRYRIMFQTARDNMGALGWLQLDLYPTAQKICGGKSVNGRFFDALDKAVHVQTGKGFTVEAEPVRYGEARPIGAAQIGGERVGAYDLGSMQITGPASWMDIRFTLKDAIKVADGENAVLFHHEEILRFAVTKIG